MPMNDVLRAVDESRTIVAQTTELTAKDERAMRIAEGGAGAAIHARTLRLELRTRLRILAREIRNSDLGIVLAAAFIGAVVGLGVVIVQELVLAIHTGLFAVPFGTRLSSTTAMIEPWRAMVVPTVGGLVYGSSHSLPDAGAPATSSTRSRPTPFMAAGCRSPTAFASPS